MPIEWVPNVSEGRDPRIIDTLIDALQVPGVRLLNVDSGWDANRTVFTLVGSSTGLAQSALGLAAAVRAHLDMRRYQGAHPCIGALDVSPFVPLGETAMAECIELARSVAAEIAAACRVPVYLYEQAALRSERQSLAAVRGRGYPTLQARLQRKAWEPDFGPAQLDERMGAVICGARELLVAFNVNLAPHPAAASLANEIAQRIRESGPAPGAAFVPESCLRLPFLRAIGWELPSLGIAQVSMNLLRFRTTGLFDAFAGCAAVVAEHGAELAGSELVGMIPRKALRDVAARLAEAGSALDGPAAISQAVAYLGLDAVKPFKAEERILEEALGCGDLF